MVALTFDGARPNRKFFNMHSTNKDLQIKKYVTRPLIHIRKRKETFIFFPMYHIL